MIRYRNCKKKKLAANRKLIMNWLIYGYKQKLYDSINCPSAVNVFFLEFCPSAENIFWQQICRFVKDCWNFFSSMICLHRSQPIIHILNWIVQSQLLMCFRDLQFLSTSQIHFRRLLLFSASSTGDNPLSIPLHLQLSEQLFFAGLFSFCSRQLHFLMTIWASGVLALGLAQLSSLAGSCFFVSDEICPLMIKFPGQMSWDI